MSGGSATEANDPLKGFSTAKKLKTHHTKHVVKDNANLYKGMTTEGYLEHAKEFLAKPCGGNIDGYVTEDGCVQI